MNSWHELEGYFRKTADRQIRTLFDEDPERAEKFSLEADGLLLDISKTSIDEKALSRLLRLFDESGVAERRQRMFDGKRINVTENRAVLHTALRDPNGHPVFVDGIDVKPGIRESLSGMSAFASGIRDGSLRPLRADRFTDVLNIGIGGSDLGPAMATAALVPYGEALRTHFVSNVDGSHVRDVTARLDPTRTLAIVVSKTFTTIETITNAKSVKFWMENACGADSVSRQFAAVSSEAGRAVEFGIGKDRVFGFEDWVGGRYSVWGPVGLSLMIAIGPSHFDGFLRGARTMDAHFLTAPSRANMPVLLALAGIWHHQIAGYETLAILPYDQRLRLLPAYLQQLAMESNGKSVSMDGRPLPRSSGPVVWGEPGTNGQHAFHQLLFQGTRIAPCEFLVAAVSHEPDLKEHHDLLLANCLAQSEVLMRGYPGNGRHSAVSKNPAAASSRNSLARHREIKGNRPSTTLIYPKLTPFVLGQILALYEHRVFVEGAILGINSFDQWGVEAGKEIAKSLLPAIAEGADSRHTGSTRQLLDYIADARRRSDAESR
ncbi:MAG: glucose-6-phosphate isomerase [Albidovulum sp.]|nr:glucose-6-phosphate isomerase [Albidovulum sp.]